MLVTKIDTVMRTILGKAENQIELLLGQCESDIKLTNTQEHVLMLLANERLSNSELAKRLGVSQAAMTKAIKNLVEKGFLEAMKDPEDGRVTYFQLTQKALPIAREHTQHHDKTIRVYQELVEQFSDADQQVIQRFLNALLEKLEE